MRAQKRDLTRHFMTIRGVSSSRVPGLVRELEDEIRIKVIEATYSLDERTRQPKLEIIYVERPRWCRIKVVSRRMIRKAASSQA